MRENISQSTFAIRIISILAMIYLLFGLFSPILFEEDKAPRKLETPDIILISIILLFNSGILSRLENLGISRDKGLTANFFKIGKDEVSLEDLGSTITDRLRELETTIESINAQQIKPEIKSIEPESDGEVEIPKALQNIVYTMLESNLWNGRHVETLANTISFAGEKISEETMLKFLRSRDDIIIRLDKKGEKWLAILKERL